VVKTLFNGMLKVTIDSH